MKNMKNCISQSLSVAVCLAVVLVGFANSPKAIAQKHGLDTAVTSRIQDLDLTTSVGYRIESDTLGPYYNGVDSVQSVLQASSGDWVLDTKSSATRKVLVDFRDPVPNSGATPPFAFQQVPARLIAKAHDTSSTSILGMTGLNSTLLSPLSVAFDYGGSSYGVRMNPSNWPQTNYALVTCTGVVDPANPATSQCKQWRIEPSLTQPDGQRKSIAHLERLPKGRPAVSESLGDFYMSFLIGVMNP